LFTGIIEEVGRIREIRSAFPGSTLTIAAGRIAPSLNVGDSVAVNGVCLTVTRRGDETFACDLSSETLERSSLGRAKQGMTVNLERPLTASARLGGHFVQGHVDAMGSLVSSRPSGEGRVVEFSYPPDIERYLVFKGSVAVDGISLTIASLKPKSFTVAVVPHTVQATTLGDLRVGSRVNLEVDILGKYVERFLQMGSARNEAPKLNWNLLGEESY
jgi:riboflavin synthase